MDILIIEDELPARAKLVDMLLRLDSKSRIVGELGSVRETLTWLDAHPEPDLALVDIQLSDDHSFEIFRRKVVQFPIIFTTAYDKFLQQSFEFNSIDYLLKPITEDKLSRALNKIRNLQRHFQRSILDLVWENGSKNNDRIIARKGSDFVVVSLNDVAYFYTEHKIVFLRDLSGRQLMVDKTLSELEPTLGDRFFRLNRKYLSHIQAIDRFRSDQGKVRVFLRPETREDVHVSKEQAGSFRDWANGSG